MQVLIAAPLYVLFHSFQYRADDAADYSTFHSPPGFGRQVTIDGMRQFCDGQRLQPNASGTGQRGEEDAISPENHILDPWDCRDLERNAGLESSDVPGMNPQSFAGLKIAYDEF